jgi:hypothetical protein
MVWIEHAPGRQMIGRHALVRAPLLLKVKLLVIAENRFVSHGKLDALAPTRAAVDEITHENDAVARANSEPVEQGDGFVVAAVQISDDDGSAAHNATTDAQLRKF